MAKTSAPRAPDRAYLEKLRSELEQQYGTQDEQIRRMRLVRTLEQPVPLDDKYRLVAIEVRDPTIADEAQRVHATLSLNRPKLQVIPARESDTAEEEATLREKWTEAALWEAGGRAPGHNTYSALVDATANDGGGWCKLVFSKDLWDARWAIKPPKESEDTAAYQDYDRKTEDAKKGAGVPFHWIAVDTLTVYPVWSGPGVLREVLEVTERPVHSTFRQYRLTRDGSGNIVPDELGEPSATQTSDSASTVEMVEHWDDTFCTWMVCGKNLAGESTSAQIKQYKHGYGQVPYFYAPGLTPNFYRNRKTGMSVSETKRWLCEYLGFLLTLHAQYAARDLLTPLFRRVPEGAAPLVGSDGMPLAREDGPQPGEIINGRPGEEMEPIQYPTTSAALKEQIALVKEMIDKLETPRVTSLSGLEGAGFAISQVLSEMRLRYDPIAQSLERMLLDLTRFLWRLVRTKVRETVWVYGQGDKAGWLKAGPDELTETVGMRWTVDPERPEANLVKSRYWHERVKAGTAHQDQAVEALGDNPDEVRRGRARDELRASAQYKAWQKTVTFQKAGRGDLLSLAIESEKIAMEGMIPGVSPLALGAGVPGGMGNGMVPDMGALAASPNGQGVATNGQTGTSPGVVVPTAGAAAGIQSMGA